MTVAATIDSSAARKAMIDSQLRVSGITDPAVLAAMADVAREDHVPAAARAHAYIDRAIPLGEGHALAAPLVQGMILSEAAPSTADRVLVISASSYLAALVEAMGASVDVASPADAAAGKPGGVGYTLVLVDGAVEQLPEALLGVLGDGCRIVTGLAKGKVTHLASGLKTGGTVPLQVLAEVGIPVLREFAAPKSWSF